MGNEKINWRDEAYTLPLADLKRIYEKKKKARTLTTSIPFMIALMILFAANYLVIFGAGLTARLPVWFILAGLISIIAMFLRFFFGFTYNGAKANNMVLIVSGTDLLIQFAISFCCSNLLYFALSVIFSGYVILLRPYVLSLDSDIAFLRAMPTFPFNGRVSDQMINVAEQKRKIQLIESAKGNIYSDNAEQIFEMPVPEPPQYEKGDTPEDYLQRKHMYIDGKFTKTSLTDEEYDRQEDELYERRMFTDRKKKAEGLPIAPEAIPDDGRLQEFDFTDHGKLNETYLISDDVFTEDFEQIQKTKPAGNEQEIKVSQDVFLEEFDFSQRKEEE